jgi:hypothetical protein
MDSSSGRISLGTEQHVRLGRTLLAAWQDHQVDEIRLLRYLPHVRGLLEELVGGLDVGVEGADHPLRLPVAGFGALAGEPATEPFGGVVLALLCGAREQLADIGVDAEDEGNRVEHDPHQWASRVGVYRFRVAAQNNGERTSVRQSEEGMKAVRGRARLGMLALACVAGLTACKDSGLPDRNLPLQEARHRQFAYPAYQPLANNAPVAAAGRHWLRSAAVEQIPANVLVPVATGRTARQLYAVRGAQAPYSRLYAPAGPGRWTPYLRLN